MENLKINIIPFKHPSVKKEFGFYKESLITLTKKGQQGEQEIKAMMTKLRNAAPQTINGIVTARALDYQSGKERDLQSGKEASLPFPTSDVLQYYLEDGTKVSVRPSGTEPKIKFYISVNTKLASRQDYDTVNTVLDKKLKAIESYLLSL